MIDTKGFSHPLLELANQGSIRDTARVQGGLDRPEDRPGILQSGSGKSKGRTENGLAAEDRRLAAHLERGFAKEDSSRSE